MSAFKPHLHARNWCTGTDVAYRRIQRSGEEHESPKHKIIGNLRMKDYHVLKNTYETTNSCISSGTHVQVKPPGCANNNQQVIYQRTLAEKMKNSSFMPLVPGPSEYGRSFVRKKCTPLNTKVEPPNPYAVCKKYSLIGGQTKIVPVTESSLHKLLDPYLSTTHMIHRPFSEHELHNKVNSKNIFTYYDFAQVPKMRGFVSKEGGFFGKDIPSRKEPIYDKFIFKTECKDRCMLKQTYAVPNKGTVSEMKAKYLPLKDEVSATVSTRVERPYPTRWDPCPLPNLYATEYNLIETGNPVRSIVDPGKTTQVNVCPRNMRKFKVK